MSPDYGVAQLLYALRDYLPDGKGLRSDGSPVRPADEIQRRTRLLPDQNAGRRAFIQVMVSVGPLQTEPENSCSHLSLLTWSYAVPQPNTPEDNSQNPTNKAKNRASQAAPEIFTFV